MNSKSDWQSASRELAAEQRQKLGAPPTPEELDAYVRGVLPPEQEERVREFLVCNPEIARMLAEPFPAEDPRAGEPGYATDEELSKRWHALQKVMHVPNGTAIVDPARRVLQFHRRVTTAMAAALVLTFTGLLWQTIDKRRVVNQLSQPRAEWQEVGLRSGRTRGTGTTYSTIDAPRTDVLLRVPAVVVPHFSAYRITIFDEAGRSLWTSAKVTRLDDEEFAVVVPPAYLPPGRYHVVLYGLNAGREEKLESYALAVRPAPAADAAP